MRSATARLDLVVSDQEVPRMEKEQLRKVVCPPLTFTELRDMLARHTDSAAITKVIEGALRRRLSDGAKESI
jgi:hypothetical protein